jgi:hypothetical protein
MPHNTCNVPNCSLPVKGHGWCNKHYQRWSKTGSPTGSTRPSLAERMERQLVPTVNGCIEWTGTRMRLGYGKIGIGTKVFLTHRIAWELANGPIAGDLFVCHACDNPPCCNVDHLFLGTNKANMEDMARKGRAHFSGVTHCIRGHEFTKQNTRLSGTRRQCKTCTNDASTRYRARKTAGTGVGMAITFADGIRRQLLDTATDA